MIMGAVLGKPEAGPRDLSAPRATSADYPLQVVERFVRKVRFEPFEVEDLSAVREATRALLESWGAADPEVLAELESGAACGEVSPSSLQREASLT